ncbi:MAG: FAD:protein FMN transferase [Kiritimatiellae bacterium]|nr:FAD:protein FMN transferase [Kiritimatiellia bacterium]
MGARIPYGLLAVALLTSAGCRRAAEPAGPVKQSSLAMGTVVSVSVPAAGAADLRKAMAVARNTLLDLEETLSVYKPASEISRLNRAAGRHSVGLSPSTYEVLRAAKQYGELTSGAFDVTVSPLVALWGFRSGQPTAAPVSAGEVQAVLKQVGGEHLILGQRTAYLDREGLSVDLGGIAKGYAVDVVCQRLSAAGIGNVMVDLGGNIRCLGQAEAGRPWRVGVRNPFRRDAILGILQLTGDESVATSGNYERFVVIEGRRYSHIIDPHTGYPARGVAGVTVIASSATAADAAATGLFVLGLERGPAALRGMQRFVKGCAWVPDREPLEIHVTDGFARYFTPLAETAGRVVVLPPPAARQPPAGL